MPLLRAGDGEASHSSASFLLRANRYGPDDECDHSMSLRLIKRLQHLASDGENIME